MTELPDRIVFERPDGFEITEREDIELVFRLASRLELTPVETIIHAPTRIDDNAIARSDGEVRRETDARLL